MISQNLACLAALRPHLTKVMELSSALHLAVIFRWTPTRIVSPVPYA